MRRARIYVAFTLAGSLTLLGLACGESSPAGAVDAGEPDAGADTGALGVSVHAVFDLPRTSATEALSATAFEPTTRTLFALQDTQARVVPLVASDDFTTWSVGAPIALAARPANPWDGEGLALAGDVFVAVTNETAPTVERFDRAGRFIDSVIMPARFAAQAAGNKGLESMALSPSARYLVTANESALTSDGAAASTVRGTTVRILRRDAQTGADEEYAYRTDPRAPGGGGDMGVSEIAAVSDDVLLVLERGYQPGFGNTVKIYRVDLAGGARVGDVASLTDATPVLGKTLVVDIGALPPGDVTHPSVQPNPLLDNYEALSIGPAQPDGRRLVFVTSDDNTSKEQVARVLVLAVPGL